MAQHKLLIDRAKADGIQVTDIGHLTNQPAAILKKNGTAELVLDGVPSSWITGRSKLYCDNKQLTKLVYEDLGLPYGQSISFKEVDEPGLKDFMVDGKNYVCKPLDSAQGTGVVMNIQSMEMVREYYEKHQHLASTFMLEEQLEGEDLRIHVIGGKIVAACIREPAYVIGNGIDTVQKLIENRRVVMKTQNPNNVLEVDEPTLRLLKEQSIELQDIPAANQKVRLKYISNMAKGGIAIDVSDDIHPIFGEWVTQLSNYLGTGYFGLDLMSTDYQDKAIESTNVLEINAYADWMHHTFSERKTHDIPGIILKELFG